MDFKRATDRLTVCVSHVDIAEAAGVSVQLIRQARVDPTSDSYRNPPNGWQRIVARLARQRAKELIALADDVERG
jgi:hypothetical protein